MTGARAIAAAALAVAAAGCPGELERPERFTSCPPGYVEQLLQTKCGSCHGGAEPEAGLDLTGTGIEARLVGEPSATPFCQGKILIDPEADDPLDHLLIDKLAEVPSCGGRMPFGAEALSPEEIECVRRWVDASLGGAP